MKFRKAKKDISAGEVVLSEEPYSQLIVNQPDSIDYGVCCECFTICHQNIK